MATVTETGNIRAVTTEHPGVAGSAWHTRYVRADDAEIGSVTTVYEHTHGTITSGLRRGLHGPVTFTMSNTGTHDQASDQHAAMLDYAEHNL